MTRSVVPDPQSREPESHESRDRAQLLLETSNALSAVLDLKDVLRITSSILRRHIRHDHALVGLYLPELDHFRVISLENAPDTFEPEDTTFSAVGTPDKLALQTRKIVMRPNFDFEEFPSPLMRLAYDAGFRSFCIVPLISRGEAIGVLALANNDEDTFSQSDGESLQAIANQVAGALENAINYKQAVGERNRFEMLLDASNALSAVLDLKDVLKITSSILRRHIRHDHAGIGLYDPERAEFRILALDNPPDTFQEEGQVFPAADTPDEIAFNTRKPVLRQRLNPEEFPSPFIKLAFDAGLRSVCVVPLISRNRAIGILSVSNTVEDSFPSGSAETIQLIANQIAGAVDNAIQFNEIERLKNQLTSEKLYLEEEIQSEYNFEEIVGSSPTLKKVLRQIETVAPTDSCVLLYGETGTGKELFSRAIHNLSARRERTLVKLNCAAIPTGLLESELFGHEKGAFTGAVAPRVGRFELAHKGTLLLDEIGDIPLELQPKLLRVLQESEFERLGSSRTLRTDVRLIAATNRDLKAMVEEGTFRSDLYYRLNVFPILIPPLRERPEDIPLLAGYFAKKHAARMNKRIETIPRGSIEALCAYEFPGNVRELENFIERAVILTRGEELEMPISELSHFQRPVTHDGAPTNRSLDAIERDHIADVLRSTGGRIAGAGGAAEILDLPVSTLRHRMKKLGLS